MIFIETPIFTEDVVALLGDDEYADLQAHLAQHPTAGDTIRGTGGLRKVRWRIKAAGKGERGGVRVIYYHVNAAAQIRLILIYRKGVKDDLTAKEKMLLRQINERWK